MLVARIQVDRLTGNKTIGIGSNRYTISDQGDLSLMGEKGNTRSGLTGELLVIFSVQSATKIFSYYQLQSHSDLESSHYLEMMITLVHICDKS